MDWRIGCSGFHYKEWKGVFYPEKLPQRLWFGYYCEHFDTIELNLSFYRFPPLSSLQNWYRSSPPGFLFSVKAPRLITHYKRFRDCARLLGDFYKVIRDGLGEKLGAVLFQFPPGMKYQKDTLDLITESLDPAFKNVVEFRNADWWNKNVFQSLRKSKTIFCGSSHPGLPDETVFTSETSYYRFHGTKRRFYSSYRPETLRKVAESIRSKRGLKRAFVYFNNTASTAAIRNALYMKSNL